MKDGNSTGRMIFRAVALGGVLGIGALAFAAYASASPRQSQTRQPLKGGVQQNENVPTVSEMLASDGCGPRPPYKTNDCQLFYLYLTSGGNDSRCLSLIRQMIQIDRQTAAISEEAARSGGFTPPMFRELAPLNSKWVQLSGEFWAHGARGRGCMAHVRLPESGPQPPSPPSPTPSPLPPVPPVGPGPQPAPGPNPEPRPGPSPTPAPSPPPPCISCTGPAPAPPSQGATSGGSATLCGHSASWSTPGANPVAGALLDEYLSHATPLTAAEVETEQKRGRIAYQQGNTPWCAIAASQVLLRTDTGAAPNIDDLVAQINQDLAARGLPASTGGYDLNDVAILLGSKPYDLTTIVGSGGGSDPIAQLQQAAMAGGPVMVGITLDQTTTAAGQTTTNYGQHAIVVDFVQGRAPNRQVVIIDSVPRPVSGVWTQYYTEPESEFLKAWQIQVTNNGTEVITRPILRAYR